MKPCDKVFCSDMTFDATVNLVVYEGGEPVFINTKYDTWNIDQNKEICDSHSTIINEDAAESLGAIYKEVQTGRYGKVGDRQ